MYKKILASMLTMTVLVASMPAEAAFGSSSRSSSSSSSSSSRSSSSYSSGSSSSYKSSPSYSSSRSSSSPSSSSSSSSKSSNSSVSGGTSMGMQRSDVASSVRDGSYKQNIPANNTTAAGSNPGGSRNSGSYSNGSSYSNNSNNYNNGGYNNSYGGGYASQGHSTGALVGAAVAGGLVGYMLHRDNSGNVYYTNPSNPNIAYNSSGQPMNSVPSGNYQQVGPVDGNGQIANQGYQQAPSKSGLGWWWLVIILAALIGLYLVFRQKKINEEPNVNFKLLKNPEEKLRDMQDTFFLNFQKNNRPSQINYIRAHTDDLMFDNVKDLVMQSDDHRTIKVSKLESEFVDLTEVGSSYVATIRYQAEVMDNGDITNVNEMWHFKYLQGEWKLAGIEQV